MGIDRHAKAVETWVVCPHCGDEEAYLDQTDHWDGERAKFVCPGCGERELAQ